jgi:hypothetical protein
MPIACNESERGCGTDRASYTSLTGSALTTGRSKTVQTATVLMNDGSRRDRVRGRSLGMA